MIITASNGKDYDLENLSESDKDVLIRLGHFLKETTSAVLENTEGVLIEETKMIESVESIKKSKKNESTGL